MSAPSLRWRLIGRLSAVHGVLALIITVVVLAGFSAVGVIRDDTAEDPVTTIETHLQRNAQGQLSLRETSKTRTLEARRGFWFVVRDSHGHELRHGVLPDYYPALERQRGDLDSVHHAAYWMENGRSPSARIVPIAVDGTSGTLIIGVGQRLTSWQLLRGSFWVFVVYGLPLTVLMAVASVPLIALVVRRTLAPIDKAMAEAARINVHAPGVRLPDGDLPREIAPLIQSVNSALDRLEEGYAAQARFMADAAHELRTPIAILQTRIETLAPGAERDTLFKDVSRLGLLCEQLLDLQRINNNRGAKTAIDLGQLARQGAADLAPLAIAAGREIVLDAVSPGVVLGDGPALTRALSNLVMNALQHGAGVVTIRVRGGVITVEDEGLGIPLSARRKVFEPFHRMKPRTSGSGLGLALVREIAQLHGGGVEVVEGRSAGAAIALRLPLLSDRAP